MTEARRASDAGEPTNAQVEAAITSRIASLEDQIRAANTKLDTWIHDHDALHRATEREFAAHVGDAKVRQYEIDKMTPDVAAAHDVKVRLDTIVDEVRLVGVGVLLSILATAAHLAGLVK